MASEKVSESVGAESTSAVSANAVDDRLIDELVHPARAEGLQLTGEAALLQQLTKRLLESALEGERRSRAVSVNRLPRPGCGRRF